METILKVEGLTKRFGSAEVLSGLDFTVNKGEFLTILGPSGCGKSTILRILIGLLEPDSGKIFENGEDITNKPPAERSMGIVFQNYALFDNMTALQNVEYAMKINKATKSGAREKALELLELVGLSDHKYKRPAGLSGGQQQRVAIARTLALSPSIILLDEPMSALDADIRLSLCQELKNIQAKFGSTMIYITHDQEEALTLSDRVMVMRGGAIEQLDAPEEIVKHPASPFVESFVLQNVRQKMNALSKVVSL